MADEPLLGLRVGSEGTLTGYSEEKRLTDEEHASSAMCGFRVPGILMQLT